MKNVHVYSHISRMIERLRDTPGRQHSEAKSRRQWRQQLHALIKKNAYTKNGYVSFCLLAIIHCTLYISLFAHNICIYRYIN